MRVPFSLFLALKYLKPKRTYLSVVTVLSVLGVLLGVAVLLIVLSVMSGFDDMWRDKILSFNAHITVTAGGAVEEPADAMAKIRAVPGVTAAAPYIESLVLVQANGRVYPPVLRGVDPQLERTVSRIPSSMVAGAYAVNDDRAVIGRDLARRLGLRVGDKLLVYSPQSFTSADELRLPQELIVGGIFEIGMWEFDTGFLLTSLAQARDLCNVRRGVHAIQVMTADPLRAPEIARRIEAVLGPEFTAQTWMDQNRQLFGALRVEKNMMFLLLIFISVVAAFCIACTLITMSVQKTREIGLLKALGFGSGQIMRVFFWQGWIQGTIGTVGGIATGLLALRYRNDLLRWISDTFHLELLPKEFYHLSEIPARTSWTDVALIALTVMAICTLAGAIPAFRAARLDPVQALRFE